jgi:hypothetical protein
MEKSMNLNAMGVMEMNPAEMRNFSGGGFLKDIWEILKDLDKHWEQIKKDFMEGYNSYECGCHC